MNYTAKYRDQRWLELAAQIKVRDNGTCQSCGAGKRLEVHHKVYYPGRDPWDYRDSDLVTLCCWCHVREHAQPYYAPPWLRLLWGGNTPPWRTRCARVPIRAP